MPPRPLCLHDHEPAPGSLPGAVGWAGAGVAACVAVGAVGSWILGSRPVEAQHWWLSEAGPIEVAAAAGYLLLVPALLAVGLLGRRAGGLAAVPRPWLLAACAACFALRELDCHKRWTTRDVCKTRFYVDPEIALSEKLTAGAGLGLAIALLIAAAVACGPTLAQRLRARSGAATLAAVGLALLFVGKGLDTGTRLWRKNVADLTLQDERHLGFVEEIAELCVPLLLLAALGTALVAGRRAGRRASGDIPTLRLPTHGTPGRIAA